MPLLPHAVGEGDREAVEGEASGDLLLKGKRVGGFCCRAPPGPRLTLLRRQGFKVEFDRTAYAARAYS